MSFGRNSHISRNAVGKAVAMPRFASVTRPASML
jgi:hypothetical protein